MPELKIAHISMQWSDSKEERQHDINAVFAQANQERYAWITGTEAESPGIKDQYKKAAEAAGFTFFGWSEIWLAVRTSRIVKGWDTSSHPVVKGDRGRYPSRGVIRASWVDKYAGVLTVLASHMQTAGISREPARVKDNPKIAAEIARLATQYGEGSAKVFYGGDQNITDNAKDSFFGGPLTSCWDELKYWPKTTGWGTIDVIASYNADTQVFCNRAKAYGDNVLPLHTDHYLIDATYTLGVPGPPAKPKPRADKLASPPVIDGSPAKHSGTRNKPVTRIVIHSAVMPCEPGRARQLGEMNSKGTGGGSWHYATDPTATFQCSWDSYVCWHAPPNGRSLGIEMADWPKEDAKRWSKTNQQKMLKRTAKLTAELCKVHDLPVKMLTVADLKAGKKGITTHARVSQAFKQSTHWDPGGWPEAEFMALVKAHYKTLG